MKKEFLRFFSKVLRVDVAWYSCINEQEDDTKIDGSLREQLLILTFPLQEVSSSVSVLEKKFRCTVIKISISVNIMLLLNFLTDMDIYFHFTTTNLLAH